MPAELVFGSSFRHRMSLVRYDVTSVVFADVLPLHDLTSRGESMKKGSGKLTSKSVNGVVERGSYQSRNPERSPSISSDLSVDWNAALS